MQTSQTTRRIEVTGDAVPAGVRPEDAPQRDVGKPDQPAPAPAPKDGDELKSDNEPA